MSARLEKKLNRLEISITQYRATVLQAKCTCRGKGRPVCMTRYHNRDELEKILYIPCSVHRLRDPGPIWFLGTPYPLPRQDWAYCTCPPHPWRDFAMGKRPRPTPDEMLQHGNEHLVSERDWEKENKLVKEIIATFEEKFSESRGLKA